MHSIITQLSLILISSFISIYILFDFFNKIFFRIYRSKIVYVISFLGIWSIFSFINIYSIGILNLLFSLIAPLLTAKFLYKLSTKKEYGMILLFILSLNIAEIVSEVVFSLLFSKHFNILPGSILVDLIIFSLYQFAMYFLLKKNSKINIQASSLALLIVPIISIIIILIITYTMAETNNEALLISLLWVCISIFLADIYIYYLFNKLASLYNQKSQFMMLQQEKNLQTKYYNELENKYTEYRQLAHDINRHLGILDELYSNGHLNEAEEYATQIKKMMDSSKIAVHTNNKIINILVNDKIDTAQRNDIEFIYNCEDTALSFIDDIDLTIILSNLLDNAFEECMNNKAEHNTINLCICQINNFNIINLTNTCYTPPQLNHNRYLSTKAGHSGIGMINVENTVKKYNGSFMSEFKDHLFTTQITFTQML